MTAPTEVTIYTDGACSGNPGPGGYAAVLTSGKFRREISGGFQLTTNNRMELRAVIESLKKLNRPCKVILYTDSQYVANGISKGWAKQWKENGWKRGTRGKVVNPDLWDELLEHLDKHEVDVRWVRGHDGDEVNEIVDKLAVAACQGTELPVDEGYQP